MKLGQICYLRSISGLNFCSIPMHVISMNSVAEDIFGNNHTCVTPSNLEVSKKPP